MSRVTWADPGTRFYETGVDRTVLYVNNVGVAWSGVKSISESPTGGAAKPYYMDGIKYLNIAGKEEFEATIEAMGSPTEFAPCDGRQAINNGLFAHQQPRKAFSLSYRTLVGNDTVGQAFGYKIHLVYNALAAPTDRQYSTTGDSSDPTMKSWALTTLPPSLTGMKPTAHFVIDSRSTPKGLLKAIEDILYGSDAADPRMPLVSELITMFQSEGPVTRTNYATNPGFRTYGGFTTEVRRNLVANSAFKLVTVASEMRRNLCTNPNFEANNTTGWSNYTGCSTLAASTSAAYSGTYGMRVTADGTSAVPRVSMNIASTAANEFISMTVRTRLVSGTGWAGNAAPYFILRGPLTAGGEWTSAAQTTGAADANGWRYVTITATIPAGASGATTVNVGWNNVAAPPNTAQFDVDLVLIEKSQVPMPYFDGNTAAADGLTYSWVGTVNASASIASGMQLSTTSLKGYTRPTWAVVGGAGDGTNSMLTYVGLMSSTVSPINSLLMFSYDGPLADPGQTVSGRFRARLRNATASIGISPRLFAYTSGGSGLSNISTGANVTIPADGSWVDVVIPGGVLPATAAQARFYVNCTSLPEIQNSAILEVSNPLIEKTDVPLPWFDGNTPASDGLTYSWTGTANNSPAIATGKAVATVASSANVVIWQGADGASLRVLSKTGVSGFFEVSSSLAVPVVDGDVVTVSVDVAADAPAQALLVTAQTGTAQNTNGSPVNVGVTPIRMALTSLPTVGATFLRPLFFPQTNCVIYTLGNLLLEKTGKVQSYFDGSTVDADKYFYYWDGTPDASTSHINTWN